MTSTIQASQSVEDLAKDIKEACQTTGFLYLTDTGIDSSSIFDISQSFFEQTSKGDKAQYQITTANEGYVNLGDELLDPTKPDKDLKEAFNFGVKSAFVDGAQKLPDAFSGERYSALKSFSQACHDLTLKLLEAFALLLDKERDFFTRRHQWTAQNSSTFRMLYYPSLDASGSEQKGLRSGEHSDYGSLTLLFQNSDISGLQILKDSGWEDVKPVPNAVLVNVADCMEFWTGGRLKSTVHRVLKPTPAEASKPRLSIAYFVQPDDDTLISAIDKTESSIKGLSTARSITAYDYLHERLNATYAQRKQV